MANEQIQQLTGLGLPLVGTDNFIVQRGAARATKVAASAVASALFVGGVTFTAVPATLGSPGTPGQMAVDSFFLYICVAANTWKKIPMGI